MTKPMKMDAMPKGVALGATDDGQGCAACAPRSTEISGWLLLLQGMSTDMPPAPMAQHEKGQEGYSSHEEALAACRAGLEVAGVPVRWRALAAHTEVYPERNAWYVEEIQRLVGAMPLLGVRVADAYAIVIARNGAGSYLLDADGASPDEAIEALYQRAYDRSDDREEA